MTDRQCYRCRRTSAMQGAIRVRRIRKFWRVEYKCPNCVWDDFDRAWDRYRVFAPICVGMIAIGTIGEFVAAAMKHG